MVMARHAHFPGLVFDARAYIADLWQKIRNKSNYGKAVTFKDYALAMFFWVTDTLFNWHDSFAISQFSSWLGSKQALEQKSEPEEWPCKL